MKASPAGLRLVTIPVSHYCEKARWAIERAALPYRELGHIQLLHYFATLRHARSVFAPVLLTPEGPVKDSTDILRYVDRFTTSEFALFPTEPELAARVARWEDLFDTTVGVEARRWLYHAGFRDLGSDGMIAIAAQHVPRWEPGLVKLLIRPGRAFLNARLNVNEQTVERGLGILRDVFDQVAHELADERRYLVGERFTAADLTFASLAALVLMPPEYGVRLPQPEGLPETMRAVVEEFRDHPAGRFALRLFREERTKTVSEQTERPLA